MGVDGGWCAPRSSKPLQVVRSCPGGFDSHILSPTGTGAAALLRFLCISIPRLHLHSAASLFHGGAFWRSTNTAYSAVPLRGAIVSMGLRGSPGGLRGEIEIFPGPLAKKGIKQLTSHCLLQPLSQTFGLPAPREGEPLGAFYQLFSCNSAPFSIIIDASACPDAVKGDGWPNPNPYQGGGGTVMTWSEFFGFLAILIELFKFFFRILRFVIKMSKKKSNRPGQR